MECGFNSLLMVNEQTVEWMLENQASFLRGILEGLLKQVREGEMGQYDPGTDLNLLGRDVRLKKMRNVLHAIVESNKADLSLKNIAVRLILRLGYVHSTSQDLILAAELQEKHKLDVTWDLMPLLDKSEKPRAFVPPPKDVSDEGENAAFGHND